MEAAHNCPEMEEHRHLQILALSVWFSKFTFLFRDGVGCAAEEMTDHVPMLRKGSARTDCNCTFPSADTRGSGTSLFSSVSLRPFSLRLRALILLCKHWSLRW